MTLCGGCLYRISSKSLYKLKTTGRSSLSSSVKYDCHWADDILKSQACSTYFVKNTLYGIWRKPDKGCSRWHKVKTDKETDEHCLHIERSFLLQERAIIWNYIQDNSGENVYILGGNIGYRDSAVWIINTNALWMAIKKETLLIINFNVMLQWHVYYTKMTNLLQVTYMSENPTVNLNSLRNSCAKIAFCSSDLIIRFLYAGNSNQKANEKHLACIPIFVCKFRHSSKSTNKNLTELVPEIQTVLSQ